MYSARLDRFFASPSGSAQRVRDVILCVTDQSVQVTPQEFRDHMPIGSRAELRAGSVDEPADLGRGVSITRLDDEESELVMNACTPRGHFFYPIKQFGQRYSFVREVPLDDYAAHPYQWDRGDALWDALSLSRLVRDNAYSTQYAARIVDYDDGEQMVVYTLAAESKHVYRLRRNREWLDRAEGAELAALLDHYWQAALDLPARVRRAWWRTEYATWVKWGDLIIPILISGLEALLKTERHRATTQFVQRVPQLAAELSIELAPEICERMYDARSEWVHGTHVRLFTTGREGDEAQQHEGAQQGPQTDDQWKKFREIVLVQDTLRAALRRCFEDAAFRSVFLDDDAIRERWPLGT